MPTRELEQEDRPGYRAEEGRRHQPAQSGAQAGQLPAVAVGTHEPAGDQANGVGDVGDQRRIAEEQQGGERHQRAGFDHGFDGPRRHSRHEQRNDFIPGRRQTGPKCRAFGDAPVRLHSLWT